MSPAIRDKIIINDSGLRSFWFIIRGYFKGIGEVLDKAEYLGREIETNDWLFEPEALAFLKEQEAACARADAACQLAIDAVAEFHKGQMDRNNRMRVWVDKKLAQRQQTP